MIRPGGLQLVVPVSVLWMGLQQSTELNLDVKHIFAGSHTEHRWRSSKTSPAFWQCLPAVVGLTHQ